MIHLGTAFNSVSIAAKAWDTYSQYSALSDKLHSDANVYAQDYDLDKLSAQDARNRGVRDVDYIQRRGKILIGAQKNAMGASGVQVGSGSFADVLRETKLNTAEDTTTAWENALREAYGYDTSATNARNREKQAKKSSDNAKDSSKWSTLGTIASGIASFF